MMTIKETKVTKDFEYKAEPYTLSGDFVYSDTVKKIDSFNAAINAVSNNFQPQKGNVYLRDGELHYNFNNVNTAEVGKIAAACEAAFAEAKTMIA